MFGSFLNLTFQTKQMRDDDGDEDEGNDDYDGDDDDGGDGGEHDER